MIICVANQKGGVGKSTTAYALTCGLNIRNKKVLLIDMDPQGNITYTARVGQYTTSVYDLLLGEAEISDAIIRTPMFDLIPAGRSLSRADLELNKTGKEYRLSEALSAIDQVYDYVIIDTPPALGILTVNALTASHRMIIPTQADTYSLQGIGQLMDTVTAVKRYTNRSLEMFGILLVRHSNRTILSRDMAILIEKTATQLGTFLYQSFIREGVALKEAQAKRTDIYTYAPRSNGAMDYMAFVDEVLKRSEGETE